MCACCVCSKFKLTVELTRAGQTGGVEPVFTQRCDRRMGSQSAGTAAPGHAVSELCGAESP